MTNTQVYRIMLLEQQCAATRSRCNHDCKNCSYYDSNTEVALRFVINILKARDPSLYFASDIEQLKEVIRNGRGKNSQT